MTWAVAVNSIAGRAFVASDIRVSWPDGRTFDGIQKVHVLGNHVVAAFAGSVALGFAAITVLQHEMIHAAPDEGWDLPIIAATWLPRLLRRTFRLGDDRDRARGLSLLLASGDPTENMGASFPRTQVFKFVHPRFKPQCVEGTTAESIGSGAAALGPALADYTDSLAFHKGLESPIEVHGLHLAISMATFLVRTPLADVGKYFHFAPVTRGYAGVHAFELTKIESDGRHLVERMPPVATNIGDFLLLSEATGGPAAGAEC